MFISGMLRHRRRMKNGSTPDPYERTIRCANIARPGSKSSNPLQCDQRVYDRRNLASRSNQRGRPGIQRETYSRPRNPGREVVTGSSHIPASLGHHIGVGGPTRRVCNLALEVGQQESCRLNRSISIGLLQAFEHWEVSNVAGEKLATGDHHRGSDR